MAVGVVEIRMDASDVDHFTWVVLEGNVNDGLEYRLDFLRHVRVAGLAWSQAESAAFSGSSWTSSPAHWPNSVSLVRAFWVAERSRLNELWWADKWSAVGEVSVVRVLGARDANVIHTSWAVWRANAASNVVEVLSALWVPEGSPFLVSWVLFNVARSSSVGGWFVAEGTVTEEFVRAKFPADLTIWLESVLAWGDAMVSDSYFTDWAGALVDTNASSVGLLPAGVILLLIPELLKVFISTI